MCKDVTSLYRQLPAINYLLNEASVLSLIDGYGRTQVTKILRHMQQHAREQIKQQQCLPVWQSDWIAALTQQLQRQQKSGLRPVFNLTGTVLHTNLGRALMAEEAIEAVARVMRYPVTLEYTLNEAVRGHRDRILADLLCELTGAEDACIVNNNAAAVLLMLATIAAGRQVIVSRGELVEIGGAFRVPEVMKQAGCQLVEVGTTNRTYLQDYQRAINEETALLMKVHTSNYRILGFTAEVEGQQLAQLGAEYNIATAIDLGSGALIDMTPYGLPAEPMPQHYLAQGVDLVSISGDKLLGGPQAGIILGKKCWIDAIQQHPLKRALRADKMTLAALEATLRIYQRGEKVTTSLPTLNFLTRQQAEIRQLAQRLIKPIKHQYGDKFVVKDEGCFSQIGSGSLPNERLASWAITFTPKNNDNNLLVSLSRQWRQLATPVIGRISAGRLWLDLRCLDDEAKLLQVLLKQ